MTTDTATTPAIHSPTTSPKVEKADPLKTPAHRKTTDARFDEEARDLTRSLPASRKVYIEGSRPDI